MEAPDGIDDLTELKTLYVGVISFVLFVQNSKKLHGNNLKSMPSVGRLLKLKRLSVNFNGVIGVNFVNHTSLLVKFQSIYFDTVGIRIVDKS